MFCLICQSDVRDCSCHDIEERLRSLADCSECMNPAAQQNLREVQKVRGIEKKLPGVAGHA